MSLSRFARKFMTFKPFRLPLSANLEQNINFSLKPYGNIAKTKARLQNEEIVKEVTRNLKGLHYVKENPEIIAILRKYDLTDEQIISSLTNSPELINISKDELVQAVRIMRDFGFSIRQAYNLISKDCNLLNSNGQGKLKKVMTELKSIGVETLTIFKMLNANSLLINAEASSVKNVINLLRKYVTRTEATDIITRCPNVLTDNLRETSAKLHYAFNEMGICTKLISQSNLFRLSMKDVFCRHKYLERMGQYKKTDPTLMPLADGTNPLIKDIFASNEKAYASLVACSTLQEFEAFKGLVEGEFQEAMKLLSSEMMDGYEDRDGDEEDDSDYDDDDDDDEEDDSDTD